MTNISNITYGCLYITASISKDTDLSSSRVGSHWLLRIEWLHIWSPGYLVLKPFQKMVPQSRMSTVGLPKKVHLCFPLKKTQHISTPKDWVSNAMFLLQMTFFGGANAGFSASYAAKRLDTRWHVAAPRAVRPVGDAHLQCLAWEITVLVEYPISRADNSHRVLIPNGFLAKRMMWLTIEEYWIFFTIG